ncbi:Fc.00g040350.m01.CDS01 [Cosmosporella sp. VM-42]
MELPFVTLDVFTKTRYAGNPLAVITIPASQDPKPTQEQKQAIAREFNLSESVFVHDVADHDVNKTREIDIFLTDAEVPFAGHPTIGTAVSLLSQGVDTVVTKAGPISLTEISPGVIKAGIPHNVHLHERRLGEVHLSSLIDELRAAEQAAPIFSIVKGMTFVLAQLPNLELLAKVKPSATPIPNDEVLDEGWQDGFIGKYWWTMGGMREENGTTVCSIRTRMVEVGFEDPATGSAACALCCWLQSQSTTSHEDRTIRYEITQGVEIGRESNIIVDVTVKDSRIDTVSLAGTATQVMRGYVTI